MTRRSRYTPTQSCGQEVLEPTQSRGSVPEEMEMLASARGTLHKLRTCTPTTGTSPATNLKPRRTILRTRLVVGLGAEGTEGVET